jgi:hypothetical protein
MSLEDKVVFGGLYKAKNVKKVWEYYTQSGFDGNDQRYNLWIPIRFTGSDTVNPGIYMIDTYQLDRIYGSYEKIVERLISYGENGNDPYYKSHNYYYNSRIRLTEEILDEFELIADLREWHEVDDSVVGNYSKEGVLKYIKLFHEHDYPKGICLVRNDAKINIWNKIECLCDTISNNIHIPHTDIEGRIAKGELEAWLETLEEGEEYNKERVEAVLELYDMIEKLANQYRTEYKDLRNRAGTTTRYEWVKGEKGEL